MPLSQATLNALNQRQQATAARTAQYSGRPAPVASMQSPAVQPPVANATLANPTPGLSQYANGQMNPQMGQSPMASPYPPYMGQKMPPQQMQNPYQQQFAGQQALDQSKQQQMFNAMASPTYNGQFGMGNMAMPQDMSSMGMPQPPMGPMPQQGLGGMAAGIGGIPAFGQQNFGMLPPTEQGGNFSQNQQSPAINSTFADTFSSNNAPPPAFAQSGLQSLLGGGMGGGLAQQQGMQGMQQMAAQPQQTPSFSGGLGGGMGGMQQAQKAPTFSQQGFFGQGSSGGSPGGGNAGLF